MFKQYHRDVQSLEPGVTGVAGVPFDAFSSFLRGAALGPARIRETFYSDSANLCTENGLDLSNDRRWADIGDFSTGDPASAMGQIEAGCRSVLEKDCRLVALGGDHSITYPLVKAYSQKYPNINILHLDAHSDLYEIYDGNPFSHACPFARIMEEKLASRLVQVGIRALTPHLRQQAARFGVEIVDMQHWKPETVFEFTGPVYISLDLDVLDPAFAPGVSHHEPGGFSTRDLLNILQKVKGEIVGADIVELNPVRDPSGITAMAAVKLLKEILAMILGGSSIIRNPDLKLEAP